MRIVLSRVFNPAFEALPEYLAAALRGLGHEVVLFDHRAYLLPGRLRGRVPALQRWDRRRLNHALLTLARRIRPQHVIVNQGMSIAAETIRSLHDLGARCVNWFSDFPAEFDLGLSAAEAYDAFHLGSSWAAARHRETGHLRAAWLPFACDPRIHTAPPEFGAAPAWEGRVVFVGSHYPERQILLRHLRGLPVDVWGPGWEVAAGDPHLAPMLRGGALRPSSWREMYGRAAAVVNIHYGAFGPASASGDMANTKVFEILACGGLQVVDRQGDVLRIFAEGEHLLAFSTGEELRARIEEALARPEAMRRVAQAGRRAVLAGHTYTHRARVLLGETVFALPADEPVRAHAGGCA